MDEDGSFLLVASGLLLGLDEDEDEDDENRKDMTGVVCICM